MRPWLTVAVFVVAAPAHGGRLQTIGACVVDPDAVAAVVDARIVSIEQPAHRCRAASLEALDPKLYEILTGAPTSSTGCVVVMESPHCAQSLTGEGPYEIDVSVDGAAHRTSYVAGFWQACGLAPGEHSIELCTPRGRVTCRATTTANARTGLAITSAEGKLRVRIENSRHGKLRPGAELDVVLDADPPLDRIELPPHVVLTWNPVAPGELPRARICARRPTGSPGCTRCSADAEPSAGTLALAGLVALVLVARRRRR